MNAKIIFLLVALVTLLVVGGCSKQLKPDGLPPLYPVSIMVIQDGQPLAGALISLHGTEDSPLKWGVHGITNSSGRAVLLTHGIHSGAPAGEYAVTVNKVEEVVVAQRGDSTITEAFTFIEKQHVDRETTPNRIHIQKKGKNHAELDVGKPVRVSLGRTAA